MIRMGYLLQRLVSFILSIQSGWLRMGPWRTGDMPSRDFLQMERFTSGIESSDQPYDDDPKEAAGQCREG